MKHGEKMLICIWAGLAFGLAVNATTANSPGTPYQGIVDRNVFGLKPPPPPPDPEATKPPPPKIILQGFTTFGNIKRALLKAQMPAKPGEPAKGEQSFILAVGQRDGDVEVLEIDAEAGIVKVNNFGTITNLNFKDNGISTAAAPAPGPVPNPAGFVPKPAMNPFTPAGGAQPARPMRLPPTGAAASPGAYGGTPAPNTYSALPATPSYGSLPVGATMPTQTAAQQQQLSGETQAAVLAAQQLANKNKVYPPAPPPIMQLLGEGNNSGSTTPAPPSMPQMPRAPSLPPLLPQ